MINMVKKKDKSIILTILITIMACSIALNVWQFQDVKVCPVVEKCHLTICGVCEPLVCKECEACIDINPEIKPFDAEMDKICKEEMNKPTMCPTGVNGKIECHDNEYCKMYADIEKGYCKERECIA